MDIGNGVWKCTFSNFTRHCMNFVSQLFPHTKQIYGFRWVASSHSASHLLGCASVVSVYFGGVFALLVLQRGQNKLRFSYNLLPIASPFLCHFIPSSVRALVSTSLCVRVYTDVHKQHMHMLG